MPRGGRVGGGSRGGGFRAPRVSSGGSSGSRGFRINIGNRAPRAVSSVPDTNSSTPHHIHHHRPWLRNRLPGAWGTGWRFVGILIALFFLGMCACVGLGLILNAMGYGG